MRLPTSERSSDPSHGHPRAQALLFLFRFFVLPCSFFCPCLALSRSPAFSPVSSINVMVTFPSSLVARRSSLLASLVLVRCPCALGAISCNID